MNVKPLLSRPLPAPARPTAISRVEGLAGIRPDSKHCTEFGDRARRHRPRLRRTDDSETVRSNRRYSARRFGRSAEGDGGNHVDHVEVAIAAISQMAETGTFAQMRFYEDSFAMSRLPRRRHLVTRSHMWPWLDAPAWASPRIGAMLFLIGLSARGPQVDGYLPGIARFDWESEPAPLSATDGERKLAAVAEHGSQVKTLGGIDRVRRFLRRGHGRWVGSGSGSVSPTIRRSPDSSLNRRHRAHRGLLPPDDVESALRW